MSKRDGAVDRAVAALKANPHLSVAAAARDESLSRETVRDALRRAGGRDAADAAPGVHQRPDGSALVVGMASDPASLMAQYGLDPNEWQPVRVRAGQWGAQDDPRAQLRLDVVPKSVLDLRPEPYEPLPKPKRSRRGDFSFAVCGDHHAPHQDPSLHLAFCSFLSDQRLDLLVVLGDVADYATVSRHRDTLGFANSVRECNRAVYKLLHDYRAASPDTRIVVLPGNHDARLEHYIHDHAEKVWGVGPAFEEEQPMYDLRRLWRLEELGVELVEGDWERAKFKVTDSLTVRHGYMISEGTPQKMLNKHSRSQVQGHSHRLRVTYKTKHDPIDVRLAAESGCMCKIEEGLGYAAEPDWQQGFLIGQAWKDGDFALAPVPYIERHGLLLPDGRRFNA